MGAIAVLAISGCDRSDETEITRAEFLVRGNAICSEAQREIGRAFRRSLSVDQPASTAALNDFARKAIIPRLERQVDALRRLPVPAGDEGKMKEIVASLHSAFDKSKKQPLQFTIAKESPYAKPDRLARSLGLTQCVSR